MPKREPDTLEKDAKGVSSWAIKSQKTTYNQNFQLIRLRQLKPGDSENTSEIEAFFSNQEFIDALSETELLEACRLALENGLVDRGLELFRALNLRFPHLKEGWVEHLEALQILDDKKAIVTLKYQAKRLLDEKSFNEVFGALAKQIYGDDSLNLDRNFEREHLHEESAPDLADELDPLVQTVRHTENIKTYMSIFQGRNDVFARQWIDNSAQNSGYSPIRRPITSADIEEHLRGTKTYGIYLMSPENTVYTGVIDIDLKKRFRPKGALKGLMGAVKREVKFILENIRTQASIAGINCIAEFSGGKGYHLWFPVAEAVEASAMRKALSCLVKPIIGKTEFFELEIFPKQDKLSGKGLGNLVKLPLGIHRQTGKRSFFVMAGNRDPERQLEILKGFTPTIPDKIVQLAKEAERAEIVIHPASSKLASQFPELHKLQEGCKIISELVFICISGKDIGERGKKILLGTVGHLPMGRQMLHFLFSKTVDYNRPLLDYEISRLRGTPLGCKRIHSLAGKGEGGLDCTFDLKKGEYPHPLLHVDSWTSNELHHAKAERIESLKDALMNLKVAIEIVERFV